MLTSLFTDYPKYCLPQDFFFDIRNLMSDFATKKLFRKSKWFRFYTSSKIDKTLSHNSG